LAQFVIFNFTNALIWAVESTALRVRPALLP
jgi:hypothetical protein